MSSLCRAINSNGDAAARAMSGPTPIVLIGRRWTGSFRAVWRWDRCNIEWVLALSISCIRLILLRHCETPKSKLRNCQGPLALASLSTAPMQCGYLVSLGAARLFALSCLPRAAWRESYPCYPPSIQSELFDTALENCRAQTQKMPGAPSPQARARGYACVRDPSVITPAGVFFMVSCRSFCHRSNRWTAK
jgi:hypothetical protein